MVEETADGLMMRQFAGARSAGIGRFSADPVSGQWSLSAVTSEILGHPFGSVAPTWSLIIGQVPAADRPAVQDAYELACSRVGAFSWSHPILVSDATRSILVVGETVLLNGQQSITQTASSNGLAADPHRSRASLYLRGYVIDLTDFGTERAQAAATEAVQNSARHRAVIEQAKGVLMLTFGLDADAAFELLVWHSQRSNRKVHAIAADVMVQVHEDELGGGQLRVEMDRILANGQGPKKRRFVAVARAPMRL